MKQLNRLWPIRAPSRPILDSPIPCHRIAQSVAATPSDPPGHRHPQHCHGLDRLAPPPQPNPRTRSSATTTPHRLCLATTREERLGGDAWGLSCHNYHRTEARRRGFRRCLLTSCLQVCSLSKIFLSQITKPRFCRSSLS
jgi:hypothetical protein